MNKKIYSIDIIKNNVLKYRAGYSVENLMIEFNIPRSTIYYWIKKYKQIKNLDEIKYVSAYENEKKKNLKLLQIIRY